MMAAQDQRIIHGEIPVVDLQAILGQETLLVDEKWASTSKRFLSALCSHGFTYIINHGIPDELIKATFGVSRQFFEQPQAVKDKYKFDPKKAYHGYTRRLLELDGLRKHDLRECFDCSGVSRFYPPEVPMFGSSLKQLEYTSKRLLQVLLRLLANALEIDDDLYFVKASNYLDDHRIANCSAFRTLYYPGINDSVELPSGTVRTKEHTDFGLITLLFQDMTGGLEVKNLDGNWIPALPRSDALLINTGDLLEFWTGGFIRATPHRVLIPRDRNTRNQCRQSIAYFVQPDEDFLVQPISSRLIVYKEAFQPITTLNFVKRKLEQVY